MAKQKAVDLDDDVDVDETVDIEKPAKTSIKTKQMKISFERDKFSQAFQLAASVAAARDVKPVLQNVKITAHKKNGVLLQATDTELGIRLTVEGCEVHESGEAILPTKRLKQILTENPEETLTFVSSEGKISVDGTRSHFNLETQAADEFPDVEDFDADSYHEIAAKSLKEMIRRTTFATDTDNARYALGGVFFELIDDNVSVVATDGRRLAYQAGSGKSINGHKVETSILPCRTLQLLERALGDDEEPVKISISANRALFQYGSVVFFSRLVEGRFPRWRNIIPDTTNVPQIDILAGPLYLAVKLAQITTSDRQPGVMFVFDKGQLELKGQGTEIGDSNNVTPITFDGPKRELKLDPKFMTDMLRVLESEKNLSLFPPDQSDPFTVKTDDNYTYIVMPLSQ